VVNLSPPKLNVIIILRPQSILELRWLQSPRFRHQRRNVTCDCSETRSVSWLFHELSSQRKFRRYLSIIFISRLQSKIRWRVLVSGLPDSWSELWRGSSAQMHVISSLSHSLQPMKILSKSVCEFWNYFTHTNTQHSSIPSIVVDNYASYKLPASITDITCTFRHFAPERWLPRQQHRNEPNAGQLSNQSQLWCVSRMCNWTIPRLLFCATSSINCAFSGYLAHIIASQSATGVAEKYTIPQCNLHGELTKIGPF